MRSAIRSSLCLLAASLLLVGCPDDKEDQAGKPIKAQAGPVGLPPAVEVPAAVLGWAVAGNPEQTVGRLEQLGAKAGPVPSGAIGQAIRSSLIELGLKDTGVVDLSKPAGVLLLDPNKHPKSAVVAVTTKGEKAVLAALEPNWKRQGAEDGIHALSRQVLDTYAVFETGSDASKPQKKVEQKMFVRFAGPTALVSPARDTLKAGGPLLLERLRAGAPAAGVAATLRLDHVRDAFAMQLSMMHHGIKQQIKMALQQNRTPGMPDPEAMGWIMDWMVDKAFAVFNQTAAIGLALGVEPEAAVLHLTATPEPETAFAQLLAAQNESAELELARALPGDCFLAMAFDVQWKPFKDDLKTFTLTAIEKLGAMPPDEEVAGLIGEWFDLIGDEMAVVEDLGGPGGLRLIELIRVTDGERARQSIKELMGLVGEWYKGEDGGMLGMRARVEGPEQIGEHAGVALDETRMVMDLDALPPQQAKAMRQVYGGGDLRMITAVTDDVLVLAAGKRAEADIKATLDRLAEGTAAKGLLQAPAFENAAGELLDGAGGFMYMSLARFMVASLGASGAVPADAMELPEAESGLFWSIDTRDGRLVQTIRLPAAHLQEMGRALQILSGGAGGK